MRISYFVETLIYSYHSGIIKKSLIQFSLNWKRWSSFWKDFDQYILLSGTHKKKALFHLAPALYDKTEETELDPIYFYQDCWAFEKIVQNKPTKHYDVGSHHKYVAFLSKVVETTMVDIRPLSLSLSSLLFVKGDILSLPFTSGSIDSLSSLCVIEHIGLGRYGDILDANGSEKAALELQRVMSSGGSLYLSVPISSTNILRFNSHRVFEEEYLMSMFSDMECMESLYIVGNKLIMHRSDKECVGLYHFKKK